jgi:hypothetical protein
MLLTAEQLLEIRKIIEEMHYAFIANAITPKAVPEEVLDVLKEKGLLDPSITTIQDSYLYGHILAQLGTKEVADMTYDQFKRYVKNKPLPLTKTEKQAALLASMHAAEYVKGLGNRVAIDIGQTLIEADEALRAKLESEIKDQVELNILRRETISELKSELQWKTKDWARDWDRIAITEKQRAMLNGQADGLKSQHGPDVLVAKQPMPDACKHCKALYLNKDGLPRIFRLSDLEANGTNVGKKTGQWQATVGPLHPNCQCVLLHIPEGWGFDETGDLVPDGEHNKVESMAKSLDAVPEPEDGYMWQGFPLVIETKAGNDRHWGDPEGNHGVTRMAYDYGYIDGTQGLDGDEIDVFVGPDHESHVVYIIEQRNVHCDTYDEQKCMLGFTNEKEALQAYRMHYDTAGYDLYVSQLEIEAFRRWVGSTSANEGEFGKAIPGYLVHAPYRSPGPNLGINHADGYKEIEWPLHERAAGIDLNEIMPDITTTNPETWQETFYIANAGVHLKPYRQHEKPYWGTPDEAKDNTATEKRTMADKHAEESHKPKDAI